MSYKQKRKEISEPDQFIKTATEYWSVAAANKKLIISVACGLLALAIVIIVLSNVSKAKIQASGEALSAALTLAERPIKGDPMAAMASEELTPFETRQAKYEAIETALTALRDEHTGTRAANTAAYYLADAKLQLGKAEEADKLYELYIASAKAGSPLRLMALEGRGYVAEQRADANAALAFFEQMGSEAKDEQWKAKAAYHRGRMLVLKGQKAEAAEAFAKIGKDFAKATSINMLAQERLAVLATEGIRPPAPEAEAKTDAKATP